MRPLDPRLLRYASATRLTLAAGALVTLAQTAAIVAFAWLVTQLVVRGIAGAPFPELSALFAGLVIVVIARGALLWLAEAVSARGGATVVGQLRGQLVDAFGRLGPGGLAGRSSAELTLVAGRGMDALDGYFARYLPQLIATAVAMPLLVLVIGWQDLTSGIILVLTLPLIPVFMVLVGWATQAAQKRQWSALSTLSKGFIDVVAGLPTLTLFGRQHRQEAQIRQVSEEYRSRTMKVLRMSFLSGFVLELAASLSVALIAVAIGLRLLGGSLDLSVGLFVLLLAPEAFLPLRNVGAAYHAATEGMAAAADAFEVLDAAAGVPSDEPVAAVNASGLVFSDVSVQYDGRDAVSGFAAEVPPGELAVLSAPSGAGKSSLVAAALGFVAYSGRIAAGGRQDAAGRRAAIAWAGQRPGLLAGTIAENVALGDPEPSAPAIEEALRAAAAGELSPGLVVGAGGVGLSGGQAQRVAVARALYRLRARSCSVLILDEPTSALDAATEGELLASLRRIADSGVAVLIVSHRESVVAAADTILSTEVLFDVAR
ncbi:thiol reductant ABC exporter subunit CydD [Leifsonia sp. TF02-11]|nr:thiol reductant ABC exporter subunit CydD [Leifsonia sp. TF02-11]MBO1738323.1 thiol reductant ABC exporter subunit CydD [Leifsonia sp. TF02-11]